ncbi:DNA mismatch repair protein MutS [Bacillus mesophilus]|uniref:DNA mismatch repair protein MutS n=1 Tax=Bacillus mesophilus TaxID=1808955 RepID=A0A6M0Q1H5_9BACI|nr:DNA mismatch repair protein MutS [Bacillus mesophilus]MBM7659277.1 DNA mismatch repair protein MutS [Bacillus mesophilus]NEY70151.1 DNA mismatch repair protein MutS [Bacillus mesophilus]
MATYTPMIQQYLKIKAEYQDAFLFFRLGDFYEMFFEDAVQASQVLEITLTSREGGVEERIPMCGVPHHAAPNYIEQLVSKGYKVAVCEQVEDPRQAKGVVKREVVQLITPGTVMEGKSLEDKQNNYIASITEFDHGSSYGFCYNDLSTGELQVTLLSDWNEVLSELLSTGAREAVVSSSLSEQKCKQLQDRCFVTVSIEDILIEFEEVIPHLQKLNGEKQKHAVSRLLHYLIRTQKRKLDHIQSAVFYNTQQFMKIDMYSKRNLELIETIRSKGKKGSLLWLLDETMTAMGGRLLKAWIDRPLIDTEKIKARHDMVGVLLSQFFQRSDLREKLKEVYDIERLAGRVAFGNVNARDLVQLRRSLQQVPAIRSTVAELELPYANSLASNMDGCEELLDLLEQALKDHPPLSVKEGDMIRDGYHEQLDLYRNASRNGKTWIAELEQKERELTGIKSLKIGYNRVFGYYIEVTKSNISSLKEGRYERKQTLANAERYITPELKEKEALILEAEEKIVGLEYDLFLLLREQVKEYIPRLQQLAKMISEVDVLQSFAVVSEERHFVKPVLSPEHQLRVLNGRHPVVEKMMDSQEYVANDCIMNDERQVLLITGPNMSGKSTYMRQIALTSIMAQIGCFVSAEEATLPVFDQVFTRIGAADDLISGQSTFMVEMLEAKNAIAHATQHSLILFDEIGRGTSTYDGMALAQAIIEYIHEHIQAKTLFSTHYHELTALEGELHHLQNVHVKAIEQNGRVVFLHKVQEGAADKSYGIHVAELAELPQKLISRARQLLATFEGEKVTSTTTKKEITEETQLSFFAEQATTVKESNLSDKEREILKQIKSIPIMELTPMDAMNKLYEIQKKLKG